MNDCFCIGICFDLFPAFEKLKTLIQSLLCFLKIIFQNLFTKIKDPIFFSRRVKKLKEKCKKMERMEVLL